MGWSRSNEKRCKIANISYDYNRLNENEVKEKIEEVNQLWEELKAKGKAIREQELLDFHNTEIRDEITREKAMQKKIIERVKKQQKRNH